MPTQQPAQDQNKQKEKQSRKGLIALILLLLLIIAALLWYFTRPQPVEEPEGPRFAPNASIGALPDKTDEEIIAMLQQKVDEKSVAFSIKYNPVFQDGSAEGELKLESPANNINYIYFTINIDETGEQIYESGLLAPNSYIYTDTLQTEKPLAKGVYPCTATIHLVDKDTKEELGMVQAAITLTIQN